jgi:vitamin B12 transporter
LQNEILFGRAAVDVTATDWWQQTVFVAHTHEDLRNLNVFPSVSRADVTQVGWQHTLPVAEWHTIVAGLDWYQQNSQFEGFGSAFDATVDNTAVFVQDQVTLWKRLSLTGGGRLDHHSQFGDEFTYRFAGVLRVTESTRFKASAGTAFKAPTLNDLFFPGFSNPALKPEESFGWDAGIEQDLCNGKATVGARFFQNSFDNLIAFPPPTFLPDNVARARTQGVELTAETQPAKDLVLRAAYTFLETEDLATGLPLLRRPKHSGSIGADYRFCRRYALHTDATFVGRRDDFDPATFGRARNAGYVKWDLALAVDVTQHFQIFGRVENLLDDQYEEAKGFPALGRVVYVGGKVKF